MIQKYLFLLLVGILLGSAISIFGIQQLPPLDKEDTKAWREWCGLQGIFTLPIIQV